MGDAEQIERSESRKTEYKEKLYSMMLKLFLKKQFDDAVVNLNCSFKITKEKIESLKRVMKNTPSEDAEKERIIQNGKLLSTKMMMRKYL